MTDQLSALRQRQQQFLASIPLVDEAAPDVVSIVCDGKTELVAIHNAV